MNLKYKYALFYIFVIILFISFINSEKNMRIKKHLKEHTNDVILEYKALYSEYKNLSNIIFRTEINRDEVIDIFQNAHKSDKAKQQKIRKALYKKLEKTYALLKQHNIKQLHFQLPNNESFLRFHRPKKFGDDLTKIRSTIAYVNRYKKPIDSFEEGKIYNGYRFVYPLFDKKHQYIGSVEVSFSTLAFNKEFLRVFNTKTIFLTKTKIVTEKVFKNEQNNYKKTVFPNYLIEKNSILAFSNLSKQTINIINKTHKPISIYDKDIDKTLTVLPIYNKLNKKLAGLFIVSSKEPYIHNQEHNYNLIIGLFIPLLFLLFYIFYKNHLKHIKLNSIIQEADSGIGTMGLNGKFKSVNHACCNLLGYTEEELLQKSCLYLTLKEDLELAKGTFNKTIEYGEVSKVKTRCKTKSGGIITLEISLKMLPSGDEFIIVMNSLEDKIQLENLNKNLQEEVDHAIEDMRHKDNILFQQSKTSAMGEMIDAIAHQWKTPLGIIKLYAQSSEYILENDKNINRKELIEYAFKTEEQINHLLTTIEEFRSFFRPKNNFENIQLNTLIESVLTLMRDELLKNTIQTTIQGDLTATINVIPNEFKHVLINLISNSKDAFNEKNIENREIVFTINEDKDHIITLQIKDNAGGIPQNIIKHIFEANVTTKKEGKGTGIGLYLVKQIIEKIHGFIEVKNLEKGTLFTIIFDNNTYNTISNKIGQ